ncbi:MAG: host cell division inhibitory peptide Kil [Serratia sp.]|nr:host cell division inhibitory peptide Kil [Serratia sp. (in: enterobacteria)]
MINHYALRCAQSKAAIATFIGDGNMWLEAHAAMKKACDYPPYRKPITGGFIPPRMYIFGECS